MSVEVVPLHGLEVGIVLRVKINFHIQLTIEQRTTSLLLEQESNLYVSHIAVGMWVKVENESKQNCQLGRE